MESVTETAPSVTYRPCKVITSDNHEVLIPINVVAESQTLIDLCSDNSDQEAVPLQNISKKTLDHIIDFYEMRSKVSEVDDPNNKLITVSQDKEFMEKLDKYVVRDIANAIDFLAMKYIYQIVCKQNARIIESITDLDKLREYTGVEDDYPNEEERQKNANLSRWMYDDY